jgi:hypothetical protein
MLAAAPVYTKQPAMRRLLAPFEPHVNFAGRVTRLDVDDARAATDGAIFRVNLRVASPRIHINLFGLAAERTRHEVGSGGHGVRIELQSRRGDFRRASEAKEASEVTPPRTDAGIARLSAKITPF